MDDRLTKLQQEVQQLEAKLENEDLKRQALHARHMKKENKNRSRERSQRTHRLIEIGAEVESVIGRQIPKEDLPAFREIHENGRKKAWSIYRRGRKMLFSKALIASPQNFMRTAHFVEMRTYRQP